MRSAVTLLVRARLRAHRSGSAALALLVAVVVGATGAFLAGRGALTPPYRGCFAMPRCPQAS